VTWLLRRLRTFAGSAFSVSTFRDPRAPYEPNLANCSGRDDPYKTPDKVVYDGPGNVPDLTFIAIATFAGLPRPRRRFDVDRVTPDWWM
jgi:hypothetical protein